ncbi:hypothetical protein chiPu_0018727 [Chiloscyllium punctatum]|uniref:Death domain-containing protein n=1 Tax=Chiloscyllium punctatum TaxID=137246 RepID=A0A401RPI2_CHIPU|nr:hypothetical protein [Chiloscyllium punctatum]
MTARVPKTISRNPLQTTPESRLLRVRDKLDLLTLAHHQREVEDVENPEGKESQAWRDVANKGAHVGADRKRERLKDCESDGALSEPSDNEMIMSKKNKVKPKILTDKKLMQLAKNMGHNWQQIGIQFLDLQSHEIDQCEAQQRLVVLQRFEMLKCWRNREKEGATAVKLHSILSNKECPISSAQLNCLLEENL